MPGKPPPGPGGNDWFFVKLPNDGPWMRFKETNRYFWRNFKQRLYWKFMTGAVVNVPWPADNVSADPNDHYRAWLETNIGKQGRDWQWDCHYTESGIYDLQIVVSRAKKQYASMIALMWK